MLCKLENDGSYSYVCENASSFDHRKYAPQGFAVALGCFDGVHAGHRALLDETKKSPFVPAIWSFSSPISRPYIDEVPDRLKLCGKLGIKFAFCEDFEDVKNTEPEEFVKHLYNLGARTLICGEDFRYGIQRKGNVNMLSESCKKLGMELHVVSGVFRDIDKVQLKVSSTAIRKFILAGEIEKANSLLTRPFTVSGCVSGGKQIGRTIGFPTLNLYLLPGRVEPEHGVYFTVCRIDEKNYPSVTNVGTRPTVDHGNGNVSLETYIIGENLDLYGKYAEIEFLHFERPEQRFETLEELKKVIERDVENAKNFFGNDNKE